MSPSQINLAFDLYGTLLDTTSVSKKLAEHLPKDADVSGITTEWRKHQLEYSWRIVAMGHYENFEVLTRKSLVHVTKEAGYPLNAAAIEDVIAAYDRLDAFPDVYHALEKLKTLPNVSCVVFSNGTEKMVSNSLKNVASLSSFANKTIDSLSHVVVDDIQTFKPFVRVYEYLATKLGTGDRNNIWLISGNPFDVVGARNVGMNAIWVDRGGKGWVDQLGKPTEIVNSLEDVAQVIQSQLFPAPGLSSGPLDLKSSESNLITYPADDPPSPSPPPSMPVQPQILKDRLYVLAQLFSKYGKISKMDFLFHKSGPQKGKPRGYAFIEFSVQEAAINALGSLNDKLLRGRRMVVTFAHQAPQTDMSYPLKRSTDTSKPTTLSLLKGQGKPSATKDRIAALEAKLRQMEEQSSQIQVHEYDQSPKALDSTPTLAPGPPGLSSSLPPRPPPSSSVFQQTIKILPSSLPSKPLVSTMPTVPSDGAQRKPGVGSGPNIRPSSRLSTSTSTLNSPRDPITFNSYNNLTTTTTRASTNPSKPPLPQRYTTNSLGIIIKR